MNFPRLKNYAAFLITFLLFFLASGCGQIAGETNYVLEQGRNVSRTLFVLSKNATLEKDSLVDGSVVMICCNLTIDGNVTGDVFLVTGNLWISTHGYVDGDVKVISGNVTR